MWRTKLSRSFNYYLLGGRKDETVSARVFIENHKRSERCINALFYLVRGERNHCWKSYEYDLEERLWKK